jgi:hypothetical protein
VGVTTDGLSKIWGDNVGNIYFVLYGACVIGKIPAGAAISIIFVGLRWSCGYNDEIQANLTLLNRPTSLWGDTSGNLFIADSENYRVRLLSLSKNEISTFAGTGSAATDNSEITDATLTHLFGPKGIGGDTAGNIYFTDGDLLRYVSVSDGLIRTLAGEGSSDLVNIPVSQVKIAQPDQLWIDGSGICFLIDQGDHNRVSKFLLPNGNLSVIAGGGGYGFGGENVPASSAAIGWAGDLWADNNNNVYIAESNSFGKFSNSLYFCWERILRF